MDGAHFRALSSGAHRSAMSAACFQLSIDDSRYSEIDLLGGNILLTCGTDGWVSGEVLDMYEVD